MLEVINDFLSGKVLIALIVGLGSYFTIRSRFVQFRHFFTCSLFSGIAYATAPASSVPSRH